MYIEQLTHEDFTQTTRSAPVTAATTWTFLHRGRRRAPARSNDRPERSRRGQGASMLSSLCNVQALRWSVRPAFEGCSSECRPTAEELSRGESFAAAAHGSGRRTTCQCRHDTQWVALSVMSYVRGHGSHHATSARCKTSRMAESSDDSMIFLTHSATWRLEQWTAIAAGLFYIRSSVL